MQTLPKKWRTHNERLFVPFHLAAAYQELCEQLLVEAKKKCPWPFLDEAVAQDVLKPEITILGRRAKKQKCYVTKKPILPGQTMVVIKTRSFPRFNQDTMILANFLDSQTLLDYLEARNVSKCA